MDYVNNFIKICLDIANYYDEKGNDNPDYLGDEMTKKIGLGYKALSNYLRKGTREVITLQENYYSTCYRLKYEESIAVEQQEYLEDVFGDSEPYGINDKDKQRIKEFVQSIKKEWDEKNE